MKTATIIGATGLIGSHILRILQNDEQYETIRVLVRRHAFEHPKVEEVIINFEDEASFRAGIEGSDVVFCTVGTTNNKVNGDKIAYRKVDYDIPVNAANQCVETGCPKFLLVSSVGADSNSNNFYLRLKGEVEDVISQLKIPSISIFRPSMLLGKRNESRPGEEIGKAIVAPLSFLFPGKYKPIQAADVARAMVEISKKERAGMKIYHYQEMIKNIQV